MPTLGSLIYVTGDATTNVDSKYGPYDSVQDAIDSLGPNGDDMLCSGLTFGVISGGAVNEYWFQPSDREGEFKVVPKSLPQISAQEANKTLKVNNSGSGYAWTEPVANEVTYLTLEPTGPNTSGNLKFVVLSGEPLAKYEGYIYIITGSAS